MTWQVPGLALSAQAFLMTISLNTAQAPYARAVASLLGLAMALATALLLAKHRYHESIDARLAQMLEEELGITLGPDTDHVPHSVPTLRLAAASTADRSDPWIASVKLYYVWMLLLLLFAVVDVGVGLVVVVA